MIDNDGRAPGGDQQGSDPQDGAKVDARADQAELTALLGHHGSSPGTIVYSDARPAARVLAGGLAEAPVIDEIERLADALRTAVPARRAPVVLVTDDREGPDGRVVAAVELARHLGRRELRIMLVDADFRALGVGGRLGQDDHLGLVDIARYGASPRPCVQATGLANVGMLGVGSFRPDEEEPFSDEELRHALAQARGLSDMVLMVAPTRLRDGSFNPLLAYVDGVVLTVSLRHASADLLESTLGYLSRLEIAVRGVVVYTRSVVAAEQEALADAVDPDWGTVDIGDASTQAPELAASTRVPFQRTHAAGDAAEPLGPIDGPLRAGAKAAADVDEQRAAEPDAESTVEAHYIAAAGGDAPRTLTAERSSSPVFRLLTLALLVLVLGFGGWWALVQRSQRAMEPLHGVTAGNTAGELRGEAGAVPRPVDAPTSAATSPPSSAPTIAPMSAPTSAPVSAPDAGATPPSPTDPEEAFPEDEIPGSTSAVAGAAPSSPAAPPAADPPGAEAARLRAQLQAQVAAGYALHVWSFPDSMEAVGASAPLARQGLAPAVRGVLIQERQWYRVLVGNFATRADANAARTLLAGQPGIDYIGVVRVPK